MQTERLTHPAEEGRRRFRIASLMAVALAVALLAVVPVPASADGSLPDGATKVMTASNGRAGFGLSLGDVLTISFDDGKSPVGDYFDTWLCLGTTFAPDADDFEASLAAGCTPFLFWFREVDDDTPAGALSMSFVFGLEDSDAYVNSDLTGAVYSRGMPGLLSWLFDPDYGDPSEGRTNSDIYGIEDACDLNGLYFIVHDFDGGDHSNFLGPLSGIPCGETAEDEGTEKLAHGTNTMTLSGETAAEPGYVPPVVVCTPDPVVPGGTVTCEVTRGPADFDILWSASSGDGVFASTGVRLGEDGTGSFSFVAPRAAACESVAVELVDWLSPLTVGVECAVAPTSLPAGEGGLPLGAGLLALVGLTGVALAGRRLVTAG